MTSFVTWNMARGAYRRGGDADNAVRWHRLAALGFDVALVQEASPPSHSLAESWQVWPADTDGWSTGGTRPWATGIVVFNPEIRLTGISQVKLGEPRPASSVSASHPGAFCVALLAISGRPRPLMAVSLYGLMDDPVWGGAERYATTSLQRSLSDITPLVDADVHSGVVLAGDLNAGTQNTPGERLWRYHAQNVAVFDRLRSLGLVDCLAQTSERGPLLGCPCGPAPRCRHVQTHRHPRSSRPWQNDYIFVSDHLLGAVESCEPVDDPRMWEASDHCPVALELDTANPTLAPRWAGSREETPR